VDALDTSADQTPVQTLLLNSLPNGVALVDQLLNEPGTWTLVAFGAQTRKVTPDPRELLYGVEPHPGRLDWPSTAVAMNNAAQTQAKRVFRQVMALKSGFSEF
jgi:hypothetical protein